MLFYIQNKFPNKHWQTRNNNGSSGQRVVFNSLFPFSSPEEATYNFAKRWIYFVLKTFFWYLAIGTRISISFNFHNSPKKLMESKMASFWKATRFTKGIMANYMREFYSIFNWHRRRFCYIIRFILVLSFLFRLKISRI